MPVYTFRNTETDEDVEMVMKYSEKLEFLDKNPHMRSIIGTSNLIAGKSLDSGRLPEAYKDRLRELKKKHPYAHGVDHLI